MQNMAENYTTKPQIFSESRPKHMYLSVKFGQNISNFFYLCLHSMSVVRGFIISSFIYHFWEEILDRIYLISIRETKLLAISKLQKFE